MTCIHCRGDVPHDAPSPVCGHCAVLLAELGDTIVDPPPAREPGSDDIRKPRPKPKDGKWLVWACNRRGRLRDAQAIGREHGFPRDMARWSTAMVEICIQALKPNA